MVLAVNVRSGMDARRELMDGVDRSCASIFFPDRKTKDIYISCSRFTFYLVITDVLFTCNRG